MSKIAKSPVYFASPLKGFRLELIGYRHKGSKTRVMVKKFYDIFIHLDTIPVCDSKERPCVARVIMTVV